MPELHQLKCQACEGIGSAMSPEQAREYLPLVPAWSLSDDQKQISREFSFKDFKEAMEFINRVAEIAESEGHHPNIHCWWNKVRLDLSTHALGGLTMNDFIVAAKVDRIL